MPDSILRKQIKDPVLGFLRCVEGGLEGKIDHQGRDIELILHGDDRDALLFRARGIVAKLEGYIQTTTQYAVDVLLFIKNDGWLDEDESAVSAVEFKARMTLKSISVCGNGDATFRFDGGDLFWGHAILVRINQADRLIDAEIQDGLVV